MPASPTPPGAARSAALVNEEIRELAGRIALSDAERVRLVDLWSEWAAAIERERGMGLAA